MPRPKLTPQLHQQIVAGIRAGGYPHVAAEAWGISSTDFDAWLERGKKPKLRPPYSTFAADVREAFAQARLKAELALFNDDAKVWLEHGPGRETTDSPGWSVAVKPVEKLAKDDNVFLNPELMRLVQFILDELANFPDAQAHLAKAFARLKGVPLSVS